MWPLEEKSKLNYCEGKVLVWPSEDKPRDQVIRRRIIIIINSQTNREGAYRKAGQQPKVLGERSGDGKEERF